MSVVKFRLRSMTSGQNVKSPDGDSDPANPAMIRIESVVMGSPTADVAENIARLNPFRRLRNALIWLFLPGVLLCSAALNWVFHIRYGLFIVFGLWMAATCAAGARMRQWPCPNCGKPVMRKGWFHNDFSGQCLHCGFSLKHQRT
jgi:hypothetical protein